MSEKVREFYDQFADSYESIRDVFDMSEIIDAFWKRVDSKQGKLLDLGCGAGEPFGRWFVAHGWEVVGVDFSARMLELAHRYVPKMHTIRADLREVAFAPDSFDAITATYSLFHVPRKDHPAVFANIYRWLRPDATALFTYATKAYTGSDEFDGYVEFMGHSLYYSHMTPEKLYALLEKIGFAIEAKDFREIGGETFLWVTVRKAADGHSRPRYGRSRA